MFPFSTQLRRDCGGTAMTMANQDSGLGQQPDREGGTRGAYRPPTEARLIGAAHFAAQPETASVYRHDLFRILLAVCVPLVRAGKTKRFAWQVIQRSPLVREHRLDDATARCWLDGAWRRGIEFVQDTEALEVDLKECLRVVCLATATGAEGRTDRAVQIALLAEARVRRSTKLPLSADAIGAMAGGLAMPTVRRSLARQEGRNELSRRHRSGHPDQISLYRSTIRSHARHRLAERLIAEPSEKGDAPFVPPRRTQRTNRLAPGEGAATSPQRVSIPDNEILQWLVDNPFHDAFDARAARSLGHQMACHLSVRSLTLSELAEASGASMGMVRKSARLLVLHGALVRAPRGLLTIAPTVARLEGALRAVARGSGTQGGGRAA